MKIKQLIITFLNCHTLMQKFQKVCKQCEIQGFPHSKMILSQKHHMRLENWLHKKKQVQFRGCLNYQKNALYTIKEIDFKEEPIFQFHKSQPHMQWIQKCSQKHMFNSSSLSFMANGMVISTFMQTINLPKEFIFGHTFSVHFLQQIG